MKVNLKLFSHMIIILIFTLLIITGCSIDDKNPQTPISVKKIDMNKLRSPNDIFNIDIDFSDGFNESFGGTLDRKKLFIKFFKENKKIFSDSPGENKIKVYMLFDYIPPLSMEGTAGKYNGRECTFYLDKSLEPQLKAIFEEPQ